MSKKSYDKINSLKSVQQKEVDTLNDEINKLKIKNKELKEEVKELRSEVYTIKSGRGEADRLKRENSELIREVQTLKNRSDHKEDITCFEKKHQTLIKNVQNLTSPNPVYDDLFLKLKKGMTSVVILAKIATQRPLTLRDCYTHVFRDTLICLLEKTFQITSKRQGKTLSSTLRAAISDKSNFVSQIEAELLKALPELNELSLYKGLSKLVYLENTAFHGSQHLKYQTSIPYKESEEGTYKFLNYSQKKQIDILFSLLKFLYVSFTYSNADYTLQLISSCWRYESKIS